MKEGSRKGKKAGKEWERKDEKKGRKKVRKEERDEKREEWREEGQRKFNIYLLSLIKTMKPTSLMQVNGYLHRGMAIAMKDKNTNESQ